MTLESDTWRLRAEIVQTCLGEGAVLPLESNLGHPDLVWVKFDHFSIKA